MLLYSKHYPTWFIWFNHVIEIIHKNAAHANVQHLKEQFQYNYMMLIVGYIDLSYGRTCSSEALLSWKT